MKSWDWRDVGKTSCTTMRLGVENIQQLCSQYIYSGCALGLRRALVECAGSAPVRRVRAPGLRRSKKPGADDPEHGVGGAKIGRSSVQTSKKKKKECPKKRFPTL